MIVQKSEIDAELGTVQLSKIENGHAQPTLVTLIKFARALSVPLFELIPESFTR